jgi:hypothetical protein
MKFGFLVAAAIIASPATAASTIESAFTRVSTVESLSAPFVAVGVQTQRDYSGLVEVNVSGSGYSNASNFNDAFYPNGNGYYQLGISWRDAPLAGGQPNYYASRLITFIDGVGTVAAGTLPAPAAGPDYRYRFVIDLGNLVAQPLQFGVLDGVYADNGGAFQLSLYQLQAGAPGVPEPASWAMLIAGFGLTGAAMRRRRAVVA